MGLAGHSRSQQDCHGDWSKGDFSMNQGKINKDLGDQLTFWGEKGRTNICRDP